MTGGQGCRSCGAPVVFATSPKGKTMIFDAKLYTAWQIDDEGNAHPVKVRKDHHATCPKAEAWKGRNRKDAPE